MTTEQQKRRRAERAFKRDARDFAAEIPLPAFRDWARDAEDMGAARVVYDALVREVQS